jgi:choline dehydrogenase-like flavoprotein
MLPAHEAAAVARRVWDVVVVGTGMGGATLGHALAARGWSVLFCEKGRARTATQPRLSDTYPEAAALHMGRKADRSELLLDAGRWSEPLIDITRHRARAFVPFIGCGTGGSSALFGMALERFFRSDFTPRRHHPNAPDSTLPEAWPIGYDTLAPYYAAAESLYRVRGSRDALKGEAAVYARAAPELSPAAAEIAALLTARGLHPYALPLACDDVPECHACQGYLCGSGCKNDSAKVCLWPAVERHGAQVLDECEVLRVDASGTAVTGLQCRHRGEALRLRARIVVMAAGALATPVLLLRSRSADWPTGLANRSGRVGRNLMRHFVDLYAVYPQSAQSDARAGHKQVACNDFYLTGEGTSGSLQSFGPLPPAAMMVEDVRTSAGRALGAWAAHLMAPLQRPLRAQVERMFAGAVVLAGIVEDLPYADNRVGLSSDGVAIRYRMRKPDAVRVARFRRQVRDVLGPMGCRLLRQAHNNERIAHACGTCRFGTDPATSVLDPHNRAHGLDNLYVVDASFFPSSAGVNPALTIAANALRVADHLADRGPAR